MNPLFVRMEESFPVSSTNQASCEFMKNHRILVHSWVDFNLQIPDTGIHHHYH
jgi:hypothetical protein